MKHGKKRAEHGKNLSRTGPTVNVIGVLEVEVRIKKVLEEIMVNNFPSLFKDINQKIGGAQKTVGSINKKFTP